VADDLEVGIAGQFHHRLEAENLGIGLEGGGVGLVETQVSRDKCHAEHVLQADGGHTAVVDDTGRVVRQSSVDAGDVAEVDGVARLEQQRGLDGGVDGIPGRIEFEVGSHHRELVAE